jgi:uncharacterized protein YlxP (DUF503 family)
MAIGILKLQLHLPGCGSLKEKRGRLQPLINKLHRDFNLSVAEIEHLDVWQSAGLACALVSNDRRHLDRSLQHVVNWLDANWPDVEVVNDEIELL